MKEYRVTAQQLERIHINLDDLSGVYKEMMSEDGCVNLKKLERAKECLGETIRALKYLTEDIENQPIEQHEKQKTLIEVVSTFVVGEGGCPGYPEYSEAFRTTGYKQPEKRCPRDEEGNVFSCTSCWLRPAEPVEESR